MGKVVALRRNWVAEIGEPMSYKRDRLGQCKGTQVKTFVKLRWKPEAVSMVLFSKRKNGILWCIKRCDQYKRWLAEELIGL